MKEKKITKIMKALCLHKHYGEENSPNFQVYDLGEFTMLSYTPLVPGLVSCYL